MRISDWSSDVCSSDLKNSGNRSSLATVYVTEGMMRFMTEQYAEQLPVGCMLGYVLDGDVPFSLQKLTSAIIAHADRKRVVSGKSVSVRVDLGGRRILHKKHKNNKITPTNPHHT